ncbi:hypothetical protein ABIC09_003874 [Bradyrhizobium sp. S3.12.5]
MRWLKFTASGKTSWGLVEGDPLSEWQWTSRTRSALARLRNRFVREER